ncbi:MULTISPECIES: type VI secretion system membrane subunit TssM [Stenotrophomonas]|uniref:type VI secretion system membrane subunit TssM n=1 Tax=Stenotrophomonas TaxID=40323 RepID=UPI0015E01E36|nr:MULTISPECIES: type VI secretion system membrane subunit TssM [Stenotrophomonas]MBA0429362.1 type VI secretion system membrane subunit TssM [Stenotrophomonas maltophilia]MDH0273903.1 type VI secretion system membrane subunit TssM [Stenotrophomonas sp. GD04089]MDH1910036.1 type VI secretion system membrane subunit TssM [Stenotrophomonas sp. GD03794]
MQAIMGALRRVNWVVAAGVLLLALLVWFGGPWVAIAGHVPLAGVMARLLVLLVLVLTVTGIVLVRRWRRRRREQRMGEALRQGDDPAQRLASERSQLERRFEEALALLRRRRGGGIGQLPWYLLIGPPGSGKTTLLQNSGLQFPLAARLGNDAVRGVGGTRQCDWWFTDQAVFLDTAGRYTTQDSDRTVDAAGWRDFLQLLRRHRRARPLNGVVVSMSLSDLLQLDAGEREQHARAIRQRLDELAEQLQLQVPVYLVLTKCDLLAGFGEFFDDLGADQRSQVWGTTFPLQKTLDGSAARSFADAYARLLDRLNARVLQRLHDERERGRRAALLAFPPQFAALGESARQFIESAFAGHAYAPAPLLRGVYFTSGTQEGTPIDRMLGAVARSFGLDAARAPAPSAAPRTFFVERLLREVVLPEHGLAGFQPQAQRRRRRWHWAAQAAVLVVSAGGLAAMAASYQGNRDYLLQARQAMQQRPQTPDPGAATDLRGYLERAVQRGQASAAAVTAAAPTQPVPWRMRWGLYQGDAVQRTLREAYLRELNATLLPGVAAQLREGLGDSASDPQRLYYYLKGYLMLGEPARLQPTQLGLLAGLDARHRFGGDTVLADAYDTQLSALLAAKGQLRAIRPDPVRVEQARASLRAAELATLVYSDLSLQARAQPATLRLDKALGLQADAFERRSGVPLSSPWPALYTQPVFAQLAREGVDDAVARFVADDWVLGPQRIDALARARLVQQVLRHYERDYIRAWDELLADLQLRPGADDTEASAQLARIAGPTSPLRLLLVLLRDQTQDLLRVPAGNAARATADAAKAKVGAAALARAGAGGAALQAALAPAVGEAAARPAGAAISDHFAALAQLCAGAPGATPLDQALASFAQLGERLLAPPAAGSVDTRLQQARQQAAQLPPPVSTWLLALTGQSAAAIGAQDQAVLDERVATSVGQVCGEFTGHRYPFDRSASEDTPLQNFAELFGNGGRFDGLFRQTLAPLLDTRTPTWRWKEDAPPGSDPALPARMQLADAIRQKYFRGGEQPLVEFTLLAPQLDEGVARLQIDIEGQTLDYTAGAVASLPVRWPGPTPGHVSVAAFDAAGTPLGALQFQGDWALFRALQAGMLEARSDLRYVLHLDIGGHPTALPLQARNLRHPFNDADLARFRCGS